ncbi:MAG: TRAM domain-containing protein [Patescibacteria group bacterium]
MIWQWFAVVILVLLISYSVAARKVVTLPSSVFFMTLLGVIIGLSVGALISLPLARLEGPFGQWLPIVVNILSVALVTTFFYNQREQITKTLGQIIQLVNTLVTETRQVRKNGRLAQGNDRPLILDTSVIIDGRILDLVETGFIVGKIVVPRFVLDELHLISDSSDSLKRNKGRRGLEILNDLKNAKDVVVEVLDKDFPNESDVDSKIIKLAKKHNARLMTVDYNLNRVAQIQNVTVLNINELNNALRPVAIPGEVMNIHVLQSGKDEGQGVGYLEDGTMVVVEGGDKFIGKDKEVVVTRVFQTVAGKMIFSVPSDSRKEVRAR